MKHLSTRQMKSLRRRILRHAFRPSQTAEYQKLSETYRVSVAEIIDYRVSVLQREARDIANEDLLGRSRHDTYDRWLFLGRLLERENLDGKYLAPTCRRTAKKGKR